MTSAPKRVGPGPALLAGAPAAATEYAMDAGQRSVLYLDVMRRRAEQYREHAAQTVHHVLGYEAEPVCDGRTLDRPINCVLVRIVPEDAVAVDPLKRPFVVVDPRAGHGPGSAASRPTARSGSR